MSLSARILLSLVVALSVVAFFLQPTVGIAMALGMSQTAAIILALAWAVFAGWFMGFALLRNPKPTASVPAVPLP